jgi:hypothetical protein
VASVNRVSLRAEFEGLKGQFEALCARGRISAEGRALIQALLMLFELLMAVFILFSSVTRLLRAPNLAAKQAAASDLLVWRR